MAIPTVLLICLIESVLAFQRLEISYDKLDPRLYRARGSDVIYGDSNLRLELGCMLPSSVKGESTETERRMLRWRKDEITICGNRYFPLACEWDDYKFARGAQVLNVQLHEDDEESKAVLGSGIYTCSHDQNAATEASTRVWVAGKYLEIRVNGEFFPNKTHRLPNEYIGKSDDLILECIVGAGVQQIASNTKISWYRDSKLISGSKKFLLEDVGKRLVIKWPTGYDGGVYMCEADVHLQNRAPIKTRQYVILQGLDLYNDMNTLNIIHGGNTSRATKLFDKWNYLFSLISLLFGLLVVIVPR